MLPRAFRAALAQKADLYICHDPDTLAVALAIKHLTGAKVGYDVHEVYGAELAERFERAWPLAARLIGRAYDAMEPLMLRRCDFITTVSPEILQMLRRVARNVPSDVVYNCPRLSEFPAAWMNRLRRGDLMCHEGILRLERRPGEMLRAAAQAHAAVGAHLKVIGPSKGPAAAIVEEFLADPAHKDILLSTGWVPWASIPEQLIEGVLGIVLHADLPNHWPSLPHKFFNYMAAGLGVLASDQSLPMCRIIRQYDLGRIVSLDNDMELGRAMIDLLGHPEELRRLRCNARQAFEAEFNWENQERKIYHLIDTVMVK
jgi:glycosyltransferase involved in cell wall biosynthesis